MDFPSIIDRFDQTVRDNPDGTAIQTADRAVDYRDFGKLTDELADELGTRCAPGEFVGIDATRGLEAITALLAALKAKRPFVFLDHRDSDTSNARKTRLLGLQLMAGADGALTDIPERWRGGDAQAPAIEGDVCYAIHTSGSTGEPKCVLIRATPLAAVIDDHVRRLAVGPGSRTLQFARLTFDGCVTEILWTLTAGGCLVVLDEARLAPGAELRDTLERHRVTHLKTTPFALTATDPTDAMRLEHVVNGGGACRPAVVAKWSAAADFHNAYGTTETTVCNFLSGPLRAEECGAGVPLGEVVGACDYHLRDGEIVITGDSVGIGYLTDEGVLPFDGEYRTGDIAELRDGGLHFVERLDRQVKVRGYRLDPGEIENAVCAADSVTEAVVTVESHDGSRGADQDALVCYYQGDADPRELRRHLEQVLDPYKIPSVLDRVAAFPYTPNGKVDRDALQQSRQTHPGGASSPDERVLDVVRGLTGVRDAGLDDNFFDIGGDSASALALVGRMREFGWGDAGVRDVLRAPDLRTLAKQLHERSG
ncbi:non-ribosomal peptide synthetase [Umezawaea sp. Da 62-37]|uniref:non-ribosomal peptide synthetase n=1 Tax=Umezawaea sp. Da 62-37 TaxID=3075927 RepID=UPI0028F733E4|nr:non-ribosomal peptide synthetase [Umezawaea sp. Da 62-37]WNV87537.1 non-ribosomal peptide synthetase [Umezawaea sp. Da 62-37]